MNTSRRRLILSFSVFLGVMIVAATVVLAYAARQMQLARFGDVFDRVVSQQTQSWVVPTLIVIAGISIVGVVLFIGLYMFLGREAKQRVNTVNDGFYNEQFRLGALTPAVWVLWARRLRRSADLVFQQYCSDLRAMEDGKSPLELDDLELSGCATLLYGLAMENLLKAIVIQAKPEQAIAGSKLRKWPGGGHDLLLLCKEAQVRIDNAERDQLVRLTAFVKWAGRYPVPMSLSAIRVPQVAVNPDTYPLPLNPHERNLFYTLYDRLGRLVWREE